MPVEKRHVLQMFSCFLIKGRLEWKLFSRLASAYAVRAS